MSDKMKIISSWEQDPDQWFTNIETTILQEAWLIKESVANIM